MKTKLYYKLIIVCILFCLTLCGSTQSAKKRYAHYPVPYNTYINDYARLMTKDNARTLHNKLKDFEKTTKIKVVIVTINSIKNYGVKQNNIKLFATGLFNKWGIGNQEKNDGILILISRKDRKCYIRLGGYYPKRYDAIMKDIIEKEMIPNFKRDNYGNGICKGTNAIMKKVGQKVSWVSFHKWHLIIVFLIFVCVIAGISYVRSEKSSWGWKIFTVIMAVLAFVLTFLPFGRNSSHSFGEWFGSDNDEFDKDNNFDDSIDFGGGASGSW